MTPKQKAKEAVWTVAGWVFFACGETMTHFPVEDHLVSFSVFDLVVEVLRQLQALIDLSFKPNSALSKKQHVRLRNIDLS